MQDFWAAQSNPELKHPCIINAEIRSNFKKWGHFFNHHAK